MGELADEFGGHHPHLWVGVEGQVLQPGSEDLVWSRCAGVALTPVAGQGVERGDPDPGVGIVDHSDQRAHGLGVDQVVEQAAAALTDGRILMAQTGADDAHRIPAAPQQLVVGRALTLRVAQAGDEGREVLSFLPGIVANWPWPRPMLTDDGPRRVGEWLRDYHAAVGSFAPPGNTIWRDGSSVLEHGQLVVHGDPGPWNAVWSEGELQGFIDWDPAGPGDPSDEVLEALWHVVPLYDDGACREAGFEAGCDRMHRAAVFLEAYGADLRFPNERSMAEAVLEHARRQRARTIRLSEAGIEPWVTLSKRGPELHLKWLWLAAQSTR